MSEPDALTKLTAPKELTESERLQIFDYVLRRIATYRNSVQLYSLAEYQQSAEDEEAAAKRKREFDDGVNNWAQDLLGKAWIALQEPQGSEYTCSTDHQLRSKAE